MLVVTGPALSTHCAQRASWCKQCKQWPGNMSIAQVAATTATTVSSCRGFTIPALLPRSADQFGHQCNCVHDVGQIIKVCQVNSFSGNIEYITEPPATVDTSWSPCRYCGGQGTGDRIRRNYNDPVNKLTKDRQPLSSIP